MALISKEMRRVVEEQRLGFAATVCEDGTANPSPKGTVTVLDDDRLMFADIASPQTVRNLRTNPSIEINVVDPIVRKGFRFKGRGIVVGPGERFDELLERFISGARVVRDARVRIRHLVVIEVERALPLLSPVYDEGVTEREVLGTVGAAFPAAMGGSSAAVTLGPGSLSGSKRRYESCRAPMLLMEESART